MSFRERKLLDVGNDYPVKGTKETIFRQIRQSPTYWKYRKHVHWYNLFNCIIQIGSGVGGHRPEVVGIGERKVSSVRVFVEFQTVLSIPESFNYLTKSGNEKLQ